MPFVAALARGPLLAALVALALPRLATAEASGICPRPDSAVAGAPAMDASAASSGREVCPRAPGAVATGRAAAQPAGASMSDRSDAAAEVCAGGTPASHGSLAPNLTAPPPRRAPLPRGHLVPTIESGVITAVMLAWNASIGAAPWAQIDEDTIGRNLRSSWVLDDDAYWINQVGHPYQGIFPFSAARSAGLGFWASTPYPFVTSAVWELVGETTPPSVNDQITTTVAGVVLGEAFHRISGMILDGSRSPGRIAAATLVAPMETINRALVGTEPEGPTPPSRVEFRAGALSFDPARGTAGRDPVVPEIGVRLSYGVPGDRRFRFERPFDHFELESTYSAQADPVATVFARGVLAGRTFEGERVRGLTGLVLQFDFSALGRYRVSTSALGLSVEGRWEASSRVALEGAATASAVLLGAAGYLSGRPDELRDYRMGPGGQAHLEVRLFALDRIATRLIARQYLVAGAGAIGGLERVSNVGAEMEVRVLGPHALGIEGNFAYHSGDAGAGAPARSETGTQLRAYYAFTTGRW
jgi:hypothetical protein